MQSTVLGQLNQNANNKNLWESNPYPIPYFDNCKLKIVFTGLSDSVYRIYADKILTDFLKLQSSDRIADSILVYRHYMATSKSSDHVKLDIKSADSIWNFVHPTEIQIDWDANAVFNICIICKCDWLKKLGIQLIYKHGHKLIKVI